MSLYIGLMSGTSMDGIDAALLEIEPDRMRLLATAARSWAAPLQSRLRRAAEQPEQTGLVEYGRLDTEVGAEFAEATRDLLRRANLPPSAIRAIGSHGQTILHRPGGDSGFTLQIGDPNVIAERLGIDVVADFRRRDVAAGGEGAPLMPAFHAAAFARAGEACAVVNIGGIANVTLIADNGHVIGFDTGPGNCLLDSWARTHLGQPCDTGGAWAASGRLDDALLRRLLAEPYFARRPPKSTGRDLFSDQWLRHALADRTLPPADVQATLAELTAVTIADAARAGSAGALRSLYVCGGGAFNADLLSRLARLLPQTRVATTAERGIAPEHVEACGFAWLAHRYITGSSGNLPSVTGARRAVPLGGLYRGRPA